MFAIIADGGRQYRVSVGDRLSVDLRETASAGDAITFEAVMLANGGAASLFGQPFISGAKVSGKVIYAVDKGPKLEVQKLRRRKNSRRHTGHRQKYTTVVIEDIQVPNLKIVEDTEPKPAAASSASSEGA
jgi:large subunit ribosomal protein L21